MRRAKKRKPVKRAKKRAKSRRIRKHATLHSVFSEPLIPKDIATRPWWFYENFETTAEQAKQLWMKEYNAGRKPVFYEEYERAKKGG